MKETALGSNEQHQTSLDILQKDIEVVNKHVLNLRDQLETGQKELARLVQEYQWERYQRQVELWAERNLTRCTNCFNVPKRNWGLIPLDSVHYLGVKGAYTHRGDHYGSDATHTQLEFHCLCTQCYSEKLKACAFGGGGLLGIDAKQVSGINAILATEKEGYKATQALRERFGRFDEIDVYWHQLPIPEKAYEIGKAIILDDDYKKVLRLIQLKP